MATQVVGGLYNNPVYMIGFYMIGMFQSLLCLVAPFILTFIVCLIIGAVMKNDLGDKGKKILKIIKIVCLIFIIPLLLCGIIGAICLIIGSGMGASAPTKPTF